jgi:hypothetical protein
MQLIDKQDDLALLLGEIVEDALETLLEFAAKLGACDQGTHVQRQHALFLQSFGDLAVDDTLRQALDYSGLADAGLAD